MKHLRLFEEFDTVYLNQKQIDLLTSKPENGMGYQKVDLILSDGKILKGRTVLNSSKLVLNPGEVLGPNDIEEIKVQAA